MSMHLVQSLLSVCPSIRRFKVDERVMLMIGMFLLAFAFYALIPMGDEPPRTITISSKIL